jgi:probable F420-dependent oxidoreductase
MRVGFVLPHIGPWAEPDLISRVAIQAEGAGFDSVWAMERSLYPLEPKSPYPLGPLPDVYKWVLDPLDALTFVAPQTSRVRLGTSVLNLPWYNPVLLARRMTTLDVLSNGRLQVGLGQGWSRDEYEAAGTPWQHRGARFEEALRVLKTIWTTDPVEFSGRFFVVPRSSIGPKPVQHPHPPIYMAAYTSAAMERVARYADGWNPVGIPLADVRSLFEMIRAAARKVGRDPEALELVVRANVTVTDRPLAQPRNDFTGTFEQINDDLEAVRTMGASEIIIDATFDPTVGSADDILERLSLFARLCERVHV